MEEFAAYNAMPRYVVSTTLAHEDPRWPATILRSTDDVAALKQTEGGPIAVHGSAALGRSLADAGLVDRYHLLVFPLLLGRTSYEAFAPIWPTMTEFAGYNAMPRFVVSTTLTSDDERWPATILRSLDEVAALRETDGGPIAVHGSAMLGASLADAGLVDRYHLLVFPVLLGAGKRLFSAADKDKTKLKLVEHEAYPNGIQKQIFDVVR